MDIPAQPETSVVRPETGKAGLNLFFNNSSNRARKMLWALAVLVLATGVGLVAARWYWTHRFDSLIATSAQQHNLDPALVKAIIYEESYFSPAAHSPQNAIGLMQVTPVVAQQWVEATRSRSLSDAVATIPSKAPRQQELSFEEMFSDPAVSLHVGCWYLQSLFSRYRDGADPLAFSLAAYNAGPTNVDRWVPGTDRVRISREEFITRIDFPATRSYVQKIIQRYDGYKRTGEIAAQ